jgi:hypothetical protein
VRHLAGLRQLTWLDLTHSRVTDACVRHFTGLMWLEQLRLADTGVTEARADLLRQALPYCDVSP